VSTVIPIEEWRNIFETIAIGTPAASISDGAVPKVVWAHPAQLGGLAQRHEAAGDYYGRNGAPFSRGENQPVVLIGRAPRLSIDVLADAPLQQCLHRSLGEGDGRL
jgi:hypothetical protein